MGLSPFSGSRDYPSWESMSEEFKNKTPNPDPQNYNVKMFEYIENYLLIKIKYPDCSNYEGYKILVYENIKYEELVGRFSHKPKPVDPHFNDKNDKKYPSPIARFEPTERGWNMAEKFIRAMIEAEKDMGVTYDQQT